MLRMLLMRRVHVGNIGLRGDMDSQYCGETRIEADIIALKKGLGKAVVAREGPEEHEGEHEVRGA
jgi:hypothetical protein